MKASPNLKFENKPMSKSEEGNSEPTEEESQVCTLAKSMRRSAKLESVDPSAFIQEERKKLVLVNLYINFRNFKIDLTIRLSFREELKS
jgi:hypothetical protein